MAVSVVHAGMQCSAEKQKHDTLHLLLSTHSKDTIACGGIRREKLFAFVVVILALLLGYRWVWLVSPLAQRRP